MNQRRSILLWAVLLMGLILVLPSSAQTNQRFLLTFIPNIQFAPLYVAIAEGYMAQAGLPEIEVEYLNEPDVIDLVAAGQADFGVVSGEQSILAASQARPISYVYEWFQRYPIGIVVDAASTIQNVSDLKGVKVGLPGRFGASYSGLTALLLANGMTESELDLQEIGFNAPDVFCMGAVQAAVVYSNNEPLQINKRAQAGECGAVQSVRVIEVSESLNLVSNGLITRQNLVAESPDYVAGVVAAWDAGLRLSIQNPALAYLLSREFVENLPADEAFISALQSAAEAQTAFLATEPNREAIAESRVALRQALAEQFDAETLIQFDVLLATIEYWDADELGVNNDEAWMTMHDTLLAMGALNQAVDLSKLYTNAFIPSAPSN